MKSSKSSLDHKIIERMVRLALKEDCADGDITTRLLVPAGLKAEAVIVAREAAVVCGLEFVKKAVSLLDRKARISYVAAEGSRVKSGQAVIHIQGQARGILTAERVALNFLGRLSGIATMTRSFVDAVRGTKAVILDTRKTTPGLRQLERYAVRVGEGDNHRFDLSEMILVKDNHRFLSGVHGSLAEMVRVIRRQTKKTIEVEVDTLEELADVLAEPPEMVLLDNMTVDMLKKAVTMVALLPARRRPLLEASGGINIRNVRSIAMAGVDRISIGYLTHSARCVDMSLDLQKVNNV